eukprot:4248094-Ditylum_brightwellii.AAC.1
MDKHLYMRGQGIDCRLQDNYKDMEANEIQHIDAASTPEQCVINVGHQREYKDVKQSFVSVVYPGDGRAV